MANTISNLMTKQSWDARYQEQLRAKLILRSIADVQTGPERIMNAGYISEPSVSGGTAATTYTITDFTVTGESKTVDERAYVAEHVDSIEQLQVRPDLTAEVIRRQAWGISDYIDRWGLNLPVGMSGVTAYDNGVIGGGAATPTVPYATTGSNFNTMVNAVYEGFLLDNAMTTNEAFMVVSPYERTDMTLFMQTNGFVNKDKAIENGYLGTPFSGFDIYMSNNLTHTVNLTMDTIPTAGNSITVNGVTFTYVANGAAASPGDISIGANVAAAQANTVLALNGTGTPGASTYVDLSTDNRNKLKRAQITTSGFTANVLTITVKGTLRVAKTMTAGTNLFGTVGRYLITGTKGALKMAIPSDGYERDIKPVSLKHGREIVSSQVFDGAIWTMDQKNIATVFVS